MPIDDDYGIDLDDDGAHAPVSHQDHDSDHDTAYEPVGSDESAYGLTKEHGHGGTSRGRSHDSDDSDSRESRGGKRSRHSDDDEKHSPKAKRSHHSGDDEKHSAKGKRSHDSEDAEPSQKVGRHPREDKHSDDSHGAKRSHDSDDERSQRGKQSRDDKHSDHSHGAKRSRDSDDEHLQKAKRSHGEVQRSDDSSDSGHSDKFARPKDRHDSLLHELQSPHELETSSQGDSTVYATGSRTGSPKGSSADVADDLISAAYGTTAGARGPVAVHRPSFEQVDPSKPVTAPVHADPDLTPAEVNTFTGPAAAGDIPTQMPLVTNAASPPAPAPVTTPPPPVAVNIPPSYAPAPPQPAVQSSVEVVGTTMDGTPIVVRPINTRMETFGGNNPNYVNGQSVVQYVDDHKVSNVPINPSQTMVRIDGILRTGPGGPVDRGPVTSSQIPGIAGGSSSSSPLGETTKPLPPKEGHLTSDNRKFPTVGQQMDHQDALRAGKDEYLDPTIGKGP